MERLATLATRCRKWKPLPAPETSFGAPWRLREECARPAAASHLLKVGRNGLKGLEIPVRVQRQAGGNFLRVGLRIRQRHLYDRLRLFQPFSRLRRVPAQVFDQIHDRPNRPSRASDISHPARSAVAKLDGRKTRTLYTLLDIKGRQCPGGLAGQSRGGFQSRLLRFGQAEGDALVFSHRCHTMQTIASLRDHFKP